MSHARCDTTGNKVTTSYLTEVHNSFSKLIKHFATPQYPNNTPSSSVAFGTTALIIFFSHGPFPKPPQQRFPKRKVRPHFPFDALLPASTIVSNLCHLER